MQSRAFALWRCAQLANAGSKHAVSIAEGCSQPSASAPCLTSASRGCIRANSSAPGGTGPGQQAVSRALLVDTLDMVSKLACCQLLNIPKFAVHSQGITCLSLQMRNFEKLGMTREQSERLTRDMTEILCINKDKIAAQFVSKSTLEKVQCMSSLLLPILSQGVMPQHSTSCWNFAGSLGARGPYCWLQK